MDHPVDDLARELESENEIKRSQAAIFAGNYGYEAASLLPTLLRMVATETDVESPDCPTGAYVSSGRILQAIADREQQGEASAESLAFLTEGISCLARELQTAEGARASLLMHALALIGPRVSFAAPTVLRIATQSGDSRIRNRAYQFASSVSPELLDEPPWSHFLPDSDEDRMVWSMSARVVE
ncbi:hypothetical protein SH449x_004838 [Pirellulaceae bacterium SH449]